MENLKLQLDTNGNATVTILEGNAPQPAELKSVLITGNIKAVHAFLLQRKPSKQTSRIEVNKTEGTIDLFENENSSINTTVQGKIYINKKLAELGINKDKKYTPKDLIKTLKFNKFLFDSPQEVDNVIAKIQKIAVRVSTEIKQNAKTQTGNQSNSFDKTTDAESHNLKMNCELYSGGEKVAFTVEIWLDVEGQNVQYWFESVSFAELEISLAENLVDSVLADIKQIDGFDLPVIVK